MLLAWDKVISPLNCKGTVKDAWNWGTVSFEQDDTRLALDIAEQASLSLLAVRRAGFATGEFGKTLSDRGDTVSEGIIREIIRSNRPGDSVLSEEQLTDDLNRLNAERVWIVDPLDGSWEFGTEGNDEWAVHIALWSKQCVSTEATAGISVAVVALPAKEKVYTSFDSIESIHTAKSPMRVVVSASRPPGWISRLTDYLDLEIVPMGSAGVKAMEVVAGRADAYIHAGGQYEWDSAAPVGVALSCGLHASRINGAALNYNRADPYLPDILICNNAVASELLRVISEVCGQYES